MRVRYAKNTHLVPAWLDEYERWLERSPITEALPGEAGSLSVHEARSKGRFTRCPLKRSSENTDLEYDPSVAFYSSQFENVIQDRYGLREA